MEAEVEIKKEVEKTPTRGRSFILRYILSLIFGWTFIVALLSMIGIVIGSLFGDGGGGGYFLGESYVMLLTVLVVFGVLHLTLAWSVDKRMILDEKAEKYTKVFGTIYNIGLLGAAAGFLVAILYPLFGWMTGLVDVAGKETAQVVTMGIISILLLLDMARYQARLLPKIPKWAYPVTMGLASIITIVLFMIFPAGEIRGAVKDQKIIDDLISIENAIDDYVSDRGGLPSGLDALGLNNLNRDISKYEFKPGNGGKYGYYLKYRLCTDGFVTNGAGSYYRGGSFRDHTKGYNCFDLQAYGGYYNSGGGDYDYDYDYDYEPRYNM